MTTLVLRSGAHYHLRLLGNWHLSQTYAEARNLLIDVAADWPALLHNAIKLPEPIDLEYKKTGRRSWLVNGQPQPVAVVRMYLQEIGLWREEIDCLLRCHKLCAAIEAEAAIAQKS